MPLTTFSRVEGVAQLTEKLRRLGTKEIVSIAVSMTGAGAKVIKTRAVRKIEQNPSIDTGSLHGAVIVKKIPKSQTALTSEHIVTVRGRGKPKVNKKGVKQAQAPHAALVEFGTVNMRAEPFMRPAIDEGHDEALRVMVDRGTKRLDAFK